MDIFPSKFPDDIPTSAPWWKQIWLAVPHLLLPIFCVTYPSVAYISRQARGGMANVLGQDYIRTARAKGLPERAVIWKHGFRNALFPLITLFASVLPAAIAGSVAIEVIFDIPGMGLLTYDAIFQKDWPIVFTVLMLGSVLTVAGMLLADILYAFTDPRIKY
ncbi:MAG: ABC transporter permease [Saprospiraceae bacterium]|nr:ABC transporter permease [Saprospiraceae bacterium]